MRPRASTPRPRITSVKNKKRFSAKSEHWPEITALTLPLVEEEEGEDFPLLLWVLEPLYLDRNYSHPRTAFKGMTNPVNEALTSEKSAMELIETNHL